MLVEAELFIAAVQWDLGFCDPRLEHRFQQRLTRSLGLADRAHCALLLTVALFGVVRMLLAGVHRSNMESLLAPCKRPFLCSAMYNCVWSNATMHANAHQELCRCYCSPVPEHKCTEYTHVIPIQFPIH